MGRSIRYNFFIYFQSIQHKLSSDYSLNIYFSRRFLLPSLIFSVRNLLEPSIHGRFILSGQIFNSHILVVVKNEDLKRAIEITNGISIAEDHVTLEALQLIQFSLFPLCVICFNQADPLSSAEALPQCRRKPREKKKDPRCSVLGLFTTRQNFPRGMIFSFVF